MVPMLYVNLENLQNNNIILTYYKVNIDITFSTEMILVVRTIFTFSH